MNEDFNRDIKDLANAISTYLDSIADIMNEVGISYEAKMIHMDEELSMIRHHSDNMHYLADHPEVYSKKRDVHFRRRHH